METSTPGRDQPVELLFEGAAPLKERAESIRDRVKQRQRPILVEFAGTPKSGKSTCIDVARHFFHRLGFNVFAPSEGVSRRTPPGLKKDLLYYNVWAACYALSQMFEAVFHPRNHVNAYDLAIFDRGIFDVLAWIDWLFEIESQRQEVPEGREPITEGVRDSIQQFMTLEPWRGQMDLVLLFMTTPEASLERENKNKLVKKEGRAMNVPSLTQLNAAYERVVERYGDIFFSFQPVSTAPVLGNSEPDPVRQTACEVVDSILAVMEVE